MGFLCGNMCPCVYICFWFFSFGSFSSVSLFLSSYFGLLAFYHYVLDACLYSNERWKGGVWTWGEGEDLEGAGGEKIIIRRYCMKNLFSTGKEGDSFPLLCSLVRIIVPLPMPLPLNPSYDSGTKPGYGEKRANFKSGVLSGWASVLKETLDT